MRPVPRGRMRPLAWTRTCAGPPGGTCTARPVSDALNQRAGAQAAAAAHRHEADLLVGALELV
jgi:hypothetical protein